MIPAPTRWGRWTLNRDNLSLEFHDDRGFFHYYVDLERCETSAAVLDWICQVAHKSWATPADTGELVNAIQAVLKPQSRLCSFGMSKQPRGGKRAAIRRLIERNEREELAHRLARLRRDPGRYSVSLAELVDEHDAARREIDAIFAEET